LQGALRPLPSAQLQSFKSASRDKAVAGAGVGPFLGGQGGICLVGAEGFEPPTLCSQSPRARLGTSVAPASVYPIKRIYFICLARYAACPQQPALTPQSPFRSRVNPRAAVVPS
jgi:hypothetical protein